MAMQPPVSTFAGDAGVDRAGTQTDITSVTRFASEIARERRHQATRWADGEDEALDRTDRVENDPFKFVTYIVGYVARWLPGGFNWRRPEVVSEFRTCMVKVATLCFAGVRWADAELAQMQAKADREENGNEWR